MYVLLVGPSFQAYFSLCQVCPKVESDQLTLFVGH